ncbi:MAG TPA: fumarylacetoacetate hydrolase family protein [Kofleriaceae bacterium]|nr:fumarylacetoacetate hydrolase family protein [Kofleriaceae bacterium]
MARDLERPRWKGQRPWLEMWFAAVLDADRQRALWVRQTLFVPPSGDGRATIWGAWFDASHAPPTTWSAKRFVPIDRARLPDPAQSAPDTPLIAIDDAWLSSTGAAGSVGKLRWDATWTGGRTAPEDLAAWLPAPTHAAPIVHDADATAHVTFDGAPTTLAGRAIAIHVWGRRRMPTLHWIYAPWLGDGSFEVQAISLSDTFSLGLASLRLDDPHKPSLTGRPATAAHPGGLITATVAGARRLIHARAWAEPASTVGYAYRDTDNRDLMVAHSDIGSASLEVYQRTAPGVPWRPVDERRSAGGVALEIHQHAPLAGVRYLGWDATDHAPVDAIEPVARLDQVAWPEVTAIVALGLTYGDHGRETGQKVDPKRSPTSFTKHTRALVPGGATVHVPTTAELAAALDDIEPGLGEQLAARLPHAPAVMDYEGELAVVALDAIDDAALAAGVAQPFGLAAANDLTARLCQVLGETTEQPLAYWACAKSFAGFLPVAPRVWAPAGGLAAIPELTIETRVNGDVRQRASTKILMYPLAALVRAARAHLGRPLGRGDVILTGTPAGVGLRMSPIARRVAARAKDRFRKAELLVSSFATSTELLRAGDLVEVDLGLAGRVRTRLGV